MNYELVMNEHVLEKCINSFYLLFVGRLFIKIKVLARKNIFFYRFINLLTDPSFSVLFVLNFSTFNRIRISLNFARQSKQKFIYFSIYLSIYLFNLLGLLFK